MRKRPVPVMIRRRIKEEMAKRLNIPLRSLEWKNRRLFQKTHGKMVPLWGSKPKGHSAGQRNGTNATKRRSSYWDRHKDRFK